ncbi:DUF4386 domain-containing protein [Stakelama tenebrarum]|uniref:DUF4386 domain-containing protein n=1 Tax=Stakelama tenebrarum TaxID=2711215 RepID=A0A6G6Y3T9_9SPHN|nr:DUF4386 domain-containing protein [Sphingosinithalassobacter tenebrarum]QIG79477.1 DUF4386 domain-containing protein [Sphingosinithalassobacter tenebrarum]
MTASSQTSPGGLRFPARAAGLFYLLTIVAGVYGQMFARASDDALLLRTAILADMVMLSAYIVVTALLYMILREARPHLSAVAAGFSLIGIAVLAAGEIPLLLPTDLIASIAPADFAALALRFHGARFWVSLIFFGVYCMLIGWLYWRSRRVPLPVGALMMLGGAVHLVNHGGGIVFPEFSDAIPRPVAFLPLLGELVFGLWLTVFAVRLPEADDPA